MRRLSTSQNESKNGSRLAGPVTGFNKQYDVTYINQLNPTQKATIQNKASPDLIEISMKNLEYTQGNLNYRKKSKND